MEEGRRERWIKCGAGLIAFGLVALAWHFGARQSGGITPEGSRKMMPAIALEQVGGGMWRLEEHRGQVVLINYWATWCGPCREEMPGLVRLVRERGPMGLAVVGVSIDEGDRGKVKAFADGFGVNYPVAFPEEMSQMAMGMEGVPTTVLVDRQGRVAKTYVGAVSERDFRTDVDRLLGER
jgi:cytochrome c biogenesis protein CcmG, thiol:disulfide interchange protein DsbE